MLAFMIGSMHSIHPRVIRYYEWNKGHGKKVSKVGKILEKMAVAMVVHV